MQMQELDDIHLLREYVENNSEAAFATLVARHVNKVYSVALRHTHNLHLAEEITQAVFVILAKKSRQLGKDVVLAGWLYQTARLTAATFIRSEIRRSRREQEAHMQTLLNKTESEVWPQVAPLLDAAMSALSEADRHAVVLRFFDGKSMREVGTTLGANEVVARKRVNRAVEKLRLFFTRRGVVVSAGALTAAISANSVQAAPAMLAKTATAVAIAKGATISGSTPVLIKGALKAMAWAKMKTVAVGVIVVAGVATSALVVVHEVRVRATASADSITQTPEAALKAMFWAMSQGDVEMMMAYSTPSLKAKFEKQLQQTSREEFAAMMKDKFAKAGGYKVVNQTMVSESEAAFTVLHEGVGQTEKVTVKKIGNSWKFGP